MTKVAVFCEGETEQLFCQSLFNEVFVDKCEVQLEKLYGKQGNRYLQLQFHRPLQGQEYLIRLFDCGGGGDQSVISEVQDLHKKFITEYEYDFIIAIRDVFPLSRDRINPMITKFRQRIPTNPVADNPASVFLILSVMEIEAWFLAEHTHFQQIDARLSAGFIKDNFGFDPVTGDMEMRPHPKADLERIYESAGRRYHISQTVKALDMTRMYAELPQRYSPLAELTRILDLIYAAELPMGG